MPSQVWAAFVLQVQDCVTQATLPSKRLRMPSQQPQRNLRPRETTCLQHTFSCVCSAKHGLWHVLTVMVSETNALNPVRVATLTPACRRGA